jgi:hypothetical protein
MAGLGLGGVFGAVAAGGIRLAYGNETAIMVLAITVGVASLIGGALAILPGEGAGGGAWSTTFVFMFGVFFGIWQPNVVKMLGGGPDAAADAQATGRLAVLLHPGGGDRPARRRVRVPLGEDGALRLAGVGGRGRDSGPVPAGRGAADPGRRPQLARVLNGFDQPVDENPLRLALFVTAIGGFVGLLAGLRTSLRRPEPESSDDSDDD